MEQTAEVEAAVIVRLHDCVFFLLILWINQWILSMRCGNTAAMPSFILNIPLQLPGRHDQQRMSEFQQPSATGSLILAETATPQKTG